MSMEHVTCGAGPKGKIKQSVWTESIPDLLGTAVRLTRAIAWQPQTAARPGLQVGVWRELRPAEVSGMSRGRAGRGEIPKIGVSP